MMPGLAEPSDTSCMLPEVRGGRTGIQMECRHVSQLPCKSPARSCGWKYERCLLLPDLLEPLKILTQLGVQRRRSDLGVGSILEVLLPVEEPVGDLEVLGVGDDGHQRLELICAQLASSAALREKFSVVACADALYLCGANMTPSALASS